MLILASAIGASVRLTRVEVDMTNADARASTTSWRTRST